MSVMKNMLLAAVINFAVSAMAWNNLPDVNCRQYDGSIVNTLYLDGHVGGITARTPEEFPGYVDDPILWMGFAQ